MATVGWCGCGDAQTTTDVKDRWLQDAVDARAWESLESRDCRGRSVADVVGARMPGDYIIIDKVGGAEDPW
jgi:hypothetical protein